MWKRFYVYIIGNDRPTLYIGVTNDIISLIHEHKEGLVKGFSEKYRLHKLLYVEEVDSIESAIEREKRLKKWNRDWKLQLIKKSNPELRDIYNEII